MAAEVLQRQQERGEGERAIRTMFRFAKNSDMPRIKFLSRGALPSTWIDVSFKNMRNLLKRPLHKEGNRGQTGNFRLALRMFIVESYDDPS